MANIKHGKSRSEGDKRRAVLLASEAEPEWTQEQIAEHCGISQQRVSQILTSTSKPTEPEQFRGDGGESVNDVVETPTKSAQAVAIAKASPDLSVGEIAAKIGMASPTVSLALTKAGVKVASKRGHRKPPPVPPTATPPASPPAVSTPVAKAYSTIALRDTAAAHNCANSRHILM